MSDDHAVVPGFAAEGVDENAPSSSVPTEREPDLATATRSRVVRPGRGVALSVLWWRDDAGGGESESDAADAAAPAQPSY